MVYICHLYKIRNLNKKIPNIELIEIDISDTVDALLAWNIHFNLPKPAPQLDNMADADYLVSANFLTQLSLHPIHYLLKKDL